MKLSIEQIRKITKGAVRIEKEGDGFHFYRFTEGQANVYKSVKPEFYNRTLATSGIRMEFMTDSKSLSIKAITSNSIGRYYFSFEVFVNDRLIGCLDNFPAEGMPERYAGAQFPLGAYEKEFYLGTGEKRVCIHFPWSVNTVIEEIALDDGAIIEGVKTDKKILIYGDSITQGYDALRSSSRYAYRIAQALHAEEISKAVGGEQFFPELAEEKDDFVPDYILVAYGTNDWDSTTEEIVREHCKGFYSALHKNYPDTPIFAISPIWRTQWQDERIFGDFCKVDTIIRECVKDYKNITVIKGFHFIPQDINYFADRIVHPNDKGFDYYFKNLHKEISKICESMK